MNYPLAIGLVGTAGMVGTAMAASLAPLPATPEGEWTAIGVAMITVGIMLYLLRLSEQERRAQNERMHSAQAEMMRVAADQASASRELAREMRELRRKVGGE